MKYVDQFLGGQVRCAPVCKILGVIFPLQPYVFIDTQYQDMVSILCVPLRYLIMNIHNLALLSASLSSDVVYDT